MTVVLVGVVGLLVGLGLGWRLHARTQRDWREEAERLDRILASDSTPRRYGGQPTNSDGPPSRVTDARIRKGSRWSA